MINLGTVVLVVFANDYGFGGDEPLRYAEADAQRVMEAMSSLGRVDRLHSAIGDDVDGVQRALAEAKSDLESGRALGEKTLLVFYYSGHADGDYLRAGRSRMTWAKLRELIQRAGADLTLGIIDACDSGSAIAKKGGEYAPPFEESQLEAQPTLGSMWISSSRSDEASYESDELAGSFFSHFLVSALRGAADVDEDGQVTLSEAYQFTFDRTVGETSLKLKRTQHPTYRSELAGEGEIVLSEPKRSTTTVVLPRETSGRWFLARRFGSRRTVLEVPKAPGILVRMSVPAGAYLVYQKEAEHILLAELAVAENQEVVVDPSKLRVHAYDDVLAKGGGVDVEQWSARVGITAATPIIAGAPPAFSLAAAVVERGRMFGFGAALSASRFGFPAADTRVNTNAYAARIFGEIFFETDLATFAADAGPAALVLQQSTIRTNALSISPGLSASVLAERIIFPELALVLEIGADTYLQRGELTWSLRSSARAGLGVSIRL